APPVSCPLSLHDALPICFVAKDGAGALGIGVGRRPALREREPLAVRGGLQGEAVERQGDAGRARGSENASPVGIGSVDRRLHERDRKSTRLNSSHLVISY